MRLTADACGHLCRIRAEVSWGSQRGPLHNRETEVASRGSSHGGRPRLAFFRDISNRWWQWIVALAVVLGAYLAAAPEHKVWLVWAMVGVGLVLAIGTVVVTKVRRAVRQLRERLRKYPELEAEAKVLREELSEIRRQCADDKDRVEKETRRAVLQGRSEALGTVIAIRYPVPVLKAVTKQDGQLLLMATTKESADSLTGGLYSVRSVLTGEVKGIVRVRGAGSAGGTVLLECRDQWVVPFWEHLEASAEINPTVPDDLELAKCSMSEIDARGAVVNIRPDIRVQGVA
jgi:hypothetical protein